MSNKNLIILIFCLACLDAFCQEQKSIGELVPEHAIRFSPLHLINLYPTIQFSYEKKIQERMTAQLELGYIIENNFYPELRNKQGYKVKGEGRYYLHASPNGRRLLYGAIELYRNSVNYEEEQWRTGCLDPECTVRIRQRNEYPVRYREHGFNLKCGFMKYFSDFFIDINSGWGIRFIDYDKPEINSEFWDEWSMFSIPNDNDRTTLSPILGVRIGYRLK